MRGQMYLGRRTSSDENNMENTTDITALMYIFVASSLHVHI